MVQLVKLFITGLKQTVSVFMKQVGFWPLLSKKERGVLVMNSIGVKML
jgi:hypothetical protein